MNEQALKWALWIVAAYFAGAVPFGFLIGKMRGVDVRTVGSKNIGATNVFRTVGKKWGLLAFLCDFLKGFVPTLAAAKCAGCSGDLPQVRRTGCVPLQHAGTERIYLERPRCVSGSNQGIHYGNG